jgi:nucleotide-binding universal stress UspA family protein
MDMIIIGAKGLGGIKGKLLGSVVNSVVHESKISVLVIK